MFPMRSLITAFLLSAFALSVCVSELLQKKPTTASPTVAPTVSPTSSPTAPSSATGACCIPDYTCGCVDDLNQSQCTQRGGTFIAGNTCVNQIQICPRPCCLPIAGCVQVPVTQCQPNYNGQPYCAPNCVSIGCI
eukprot:TRINITY_DN2184_c0_g1_i2.p2 TRINITY_DN2184_c0_g1~~TRINITY_DN2184_c0_g1_i2.p2  ORF type:complete len:135 (-),score=1.94 TRINITY_DN2184_c0_g1_i2:672-1076(-)